MSALTPTTDLSLTTLRVFELEKHWTQVSQILWALRNSTGSRSPDQAKDIARQTSFLRHFLELSLKELEAMEETCRTASMKVKGPDSDCEFRNGNGSASLRGTTSAVTIPDLLNMLSMQRKTGTLRVITQSETFTMELLDGSVVHASSDAGLPSDRLGSILVAQDKISIGHLEGFLRRHAPQAGPIGEAMTKAALISEDDLRDALEHQVQSLFKRLYAVPEAGFEFEDGKVSEIEERISLNITQLLLESAKCVDENLST